MPSWITADDPWLTQAMAHRDALDHHEEQILAGVAEAMKAFLEQARAAVLDAATVADASTEPPPPPPALDGFPPVEDWHALLIDAITAPVGAAFGAGFQAVALSAEVAVEPYRAAFVAEVSDRLSRNLWPDEVFEELRYELQEAHQAGEDIDAIRDRLAAVLHIDARSREVRARINEHKRNGEKVPPDLYELERDEDAVWHYAARRIARTETVMAFNGGQYHAAQAWQDATGEQRYKCWLGTPDTRIRNSHFVAHGQVQHFDTPFQVGGDSLAFPGDPTGSAEEIIQCRCSLTILTSEEADTAQARYEAELPNRTDIEGRPLVADARIDQDDDQDQAELVWWEGPLAPLEAASGDGRIIGNPGQASLRVVDHPKLSYQHQSQPAHDGKINAGDIREWWVANADLDGTPQPHLFARGTFDVRDPDVPEIIRKMTDGYAGSVSVDLDDAVMEERWRDPEGNDVDGPDDDEIEQWLMGEDIGKTPVMYAPDWRLAGVTIVQDPAFHTGYIQVSEQATVAAMGAENMPADIPAADETTGHDAAATVASGQPSRIERITANIPMEPPAEWFADPQLTGPTKVRVDDNGRVYGHIAQWDTPHTAASHITPPRDPHGGLYPKFHRHGVLCSDGSRVLAGPLATARMNEPRGHADLSATVGQAMAHYDDPSFCVADVVVGEDSHGIWCSGSLRPGATEFQVYMLDRYSLSGDWRGNELVAACSVSTPGFTLRDDPEVQALAASAGGEATTAIADARTRTRQDADGYSHALVASGIVRRRQPHNPQPDTGNTAPRPVSGWDLYREFQHAAKLDRKITAGRARIHKPVTDRVEAGAARIRR